MGILFSASVLSLNQQMLISGIHQSTPSSEVEKFLTDYCKDFFKSINEVSSDQRLVCRMIGNHDSRYCLVTFNSPDVAAKFSNKNNLNTFGLNTVIIKIPFQEKS